MELLKKLKKRIVPLVLAVVIFATSVVSGPASMTARAASVAVDAEFSTELAMLLYNIMETVAISSGIKDGLDDYESGSTLYDAFISYLDSAATPPYLRDTYITLADGSSMTIQDAIEAANATVGSNALKLPEEEVFAKYRTISGGKNPENSPDPSPSPTPSGDDDYVILDKFHEIAFILVSAPMLAMCTKFFEVVSQGEMDGINPAEYYDSNFFSGYSLNADGKYPFYIKYVCNGHSFYTVDATSAYKVVCYKRSDNTYSWLYKYGSADNQFANMFSILFESDLGYSYSNSMALDVTAFDTDLPVFDSEANAIAFAKSGDTTGISFYRYSTTNRIANNSRFLPIHFAFTREY